MQVSEGAEALRRGPGRDPAARGQADRGQGQGLGLHGEGQRARQEDVHHQGLQHHQVQGREGAAVHRPLPQQHPGAGELVIGGINARAYLEYYEYEFYLAITVS